MCYSLTICSSHPNGIQIELKVKRHKNRQNSSFHALYRQNESNERKWIENDNEA